MLLVRVEKPPDEMVVSEWHTASNRSMSPQYNSKVSNRVKNT